VRKDVKPKQTKYIQFITQLQALDFGLKVCRKWHNESTENFSRHGIWLIRTCV